MVGFSGGQSSLIAVPAAILALAFGAQSGTACLSEPTPFPKTCTTHDGEERCWLTFKPNSVTSEVNSARLVVNMHGFTGCADQVAYTGWQKTAEEKGMILVLPQGLEDPLQQNKTAWNAGPTCCFFSPEEKPDDVGFLRKVVEQTLANEPSADSSRVIIAGHSNGCAMAQRFALEADDLVTVVACHSFYALIDTPDSYDTPIPVGLVHGEGDQTVPIEGNGNPFNWPSSLTNLANWASRNDCPSEIISKVLLEQAQAGEMNYTRQSYICRDGNEVFTARLPDLDNNLFKFPDAPGDPDHIPFFPFFFDTTTMLYEWASQYQRVDGKIISSNPLKLPGSGSGSGSDSESSAQRVLIGPLAIVALCLALLA